MKQSLANSTTFLWKAGFRTRNATSSLAAVASSRRGYGLASANGPGGTRTLSSRRGGGSLPHRTSDRGGAVVLSPSGTALHLPPAEGPVGLGLYKKSARGPAADVLRTSAHVGVDDNGRKVAGTVGADVTAATARGHARNAGLRLLATLHDALDGDLGRAEVLHLRGIVRAAPNFEDHAGVVDGCSEVLVEALGPDRGVGTRECFGAGSLGGGATVACTLEVRVRPPE